MAINFRVHLVLKTSKGCRWVACEASFQKDAGRCTLDTLAFKGLPHHDCETYAYTM